MSDDVPTPLNIERRTPLVLPSEEAEEAFLMRFAEWERLRTRIEKLKNPIANASTWSATFLGLAVSFGLSLYPIVTATENPEAWVVPTFVVATIACFLLSLFTFWVHRKMAKVTQDAVDEICGDMNDTARAHGWQARRS